MNNKQNVTEFGVSRIETAKIEYTDRGFRQDSDQAMNHDIIRGLIEAITNADDAYGDKEGPILIRVNGSATSEVLVSVADRACGIPPSEMYTRLARLGARTSGHETGRIVRGNRGRGGKDLASFGKVRWDSIYNDQFGWLEITRDGDVTYTPKGEHVTSALRDRLGIKHGNGTVVTITWNQAPRRPQQAVLKKKLQQCVPLRGIMGNNKRPVKLQYNDSPAQKLSYISPAGLKMVERTTVPIPGYEGPAIVEIWESPQPLEGSPGNLDRQNGLLIRSGRAIHEATLFSFESNSFAQYFTGEVNWDTIDELIRDFDNREERGEKITEENPFSIISRHRDGLERTHPAYKALQEIVEKILRKHVERRANEAGKESRETADTRRRLNQLARIIAKFRSEMDEEFELESFGDGGVGGLQPQTPYLQIIPPAKVLEQGHEHTFTVQLREDALQADGPLPIAELTVIAEPEGIVTVQPTKVRFEKSTKRPGLLRGTFTVKAENVNGHVLVEASVDKAGTAVTSIDIVDPIVVYPPSPPITFMFEHSRYTVALGKRKNLLLLAPSTVVEKHGNRVTIINSNAQGVLIRNYEVHLERAKDGDWYEASISIEGRQMNATATIIAQCASDALLRARAEIRVGREQSGPAIDIVIGSLAGYYRGQWEQNQETGDVKLTVNGIHSAARRYMGPAPDFPGQGSHEAKIVIAEVVADQVVQEILQRKYQSSQSADVTEYFVERAKLLNRLLPLCHANQLADAEVSISLANYAT